MASTTTTGAPVFDVVVMYEDNDREFAAMLAFLLHRVGVNVYLGDIVNERGADAQTIRVSALAECWLVCVLLNREFLKSQANIDTLLQLCDRHVSVLLPVYLRMYPMDLACDDQRVFTVLKESNAGLLKLGDESDRRFLCDKVCPFVLEALNHSPVDSDEFERIAALYSVRFLHARHAQTVKAWHRRARRTAGATGKNQSSSSSSSAAAAAAGRVDMLSEDHILLPLSSEDHHHATERIPCSMAVVGPSTVGKSSLLMRLLKGRVVTDLNLQPTVGAQRSEAAFYHDSCRFDVNCWEVGGDKRFDSMLPQYISNAHVIVLVVCVDDDDDDGDNNNCNNNNNNGADENQLSTKRRLLTRAKDMMNSAKLHEIRGDRPLVLVVNQTDRLVGASSSAEHKYAATPALLAFTPDTTPKSLSLSSPASSMAAASVITVATAPSSPSSRVAKARERRLNDIIQWGAELNATTIQYVSAQTGHNLSSLLSRIAILSLAYQFHNGINELMTKLQQLQADNGTTSAPGAAETDRTEWQPLLALARYYVHDEVPVHLRLPPSFYEMRVELEKRGNVLRGFKRRHFVLSISTDQLNLLYYRDDEAKEARGSINISPTTIIGYGGDVILLEKDDDYAERHRMIVIDCHKRVWKLRAASSAVAILWTILLQIHCRLHIYK